VLAAYTKELARLIERYAHHSQDVGQEEPPVVLPQPIQPSLPRLDPLLPAPRRSFPTLRQQQQDDVEQCVKREEDGPEEEPGEEEGEECVRGRDAERVDVDRDSRAEIPRRVRRSGHSGEDVSG
jgi:hypothetical protein